MTDRKPLHMLQLASAVTIPDVEQLVLVVEDITMTGEKHSSNYILGVMNLNTRYQSRDMAETAAMKLAANVQSLLEEHDNATSK